MKSLTDSLGCAFMMLIGIIFRAWDWHDGWGWWTTGIVAAGIIGVIGGAASK